MKKALSIILAAILAFSIPVAVFADSEKCSCSMTPVVFVPGFGEAIYQNPQSKERTSVFPPEADTTEAAIPDIIKAVVGLLTGQFDFFGTYAMNAANLILGPAALYSDGTSPENVGVDFELPSVDTHKTYAFPQSEDDDEGYFEFIYDWRLDPIENAKKLEKYIKAVKELTKHDEIILACHSQGNTVVASYLHLYGNDGIEKILFLSPAFQGLSLVGSILTRELSLLNKGEAVEEFIKGIIDMDDAKNQLIISTVSVLNSIGIVDGLLNFLQKAIDSQIDRIFDECLIDLMGTMPGVWSFVPDEYYEKAKKLTFRGLDKYNELEEKVDYYHYNVQVKITDLIDEAMASGTDVIISLGYNISTIPVTTEKEGHSDFLIDTKYMSIGAVCAPIGKALGENYKQADTSCGHNHVSSDNLIDASTCAYPEITWFIKGNPHNSFHTAYNKFLEWAARYNGQPTVHSDVKYPQYMKIGDDKLEPVDGLKPAETRSDIEIIFSSLWILINDALAK